ncbi:hypothetical protein WJX73_008088 [Symbiochloris irregularis]|uniref:HhH-GPD domain-containing protein n=1 Tax=Symbiochloris irregularis TaxID=706552 RepID=A0AAW1PII9_9CHLO
MVTQCAKRIREAEADPLKDGSRPAARARRKFPKPPQEMDVAVLATLPVPPPWNPVEQAQWTEASLQSALQHLAEADPKLATLIESHPELPVRLLGKQDNMFAALTRSIIYQQLAGSAAAAIHLRFLKACKVGETESVLPEQVLVVPMPQLRECGLSQRKAEYLLDLARFFSEGLLSDVAIKAMEDDVLIMELTKVKGIGRWSCDMFSMFQLGRPDVLPVGDLGVRKGMQTLYGLKELPNPAQMKEVAKAWEPYRSLGSYLMWKVPTAVQRKQPSKSPVKLTATAMPNMG